MARDLRLGALSEPRAVRWGLGLLAVALVGCLAVLPLPFSLEGGPGFFAEDRHRPFFHNVFIGLWWASLANLVLTLALWATVPLWLHPVPPAPREPAARKGWPRGVTAALLACAVLLGLALRAPLASGSLWWDEAWNIRHVVVGGYVEDAESPGERRWSERTWHRAAWYGKKPTNPPLYSIAALATHELWRAISPGPRHRLNEVAYRLPALAATAVSIVAISALCGVLGFPRAGVLAAFLLALHPWHIRHGTEGRAYSFVVAFVLLASIAAVRWLRQRRDRDLLAYAAAQAGLLWTWTFGMVVTAGMGVALSLALLTARAPREERAALFGRFFVANLLAGMFVLQVLAPVITMMPHWDYSSGGMGVLQNAMAGLATGMRWNVADPASGIPALRDLVQHPVRAAVLAGFLLLALAGFAALLRGARPARWVALGWLGAWALTLAASLHPYVYLFARYKTYLLPVITTAAAVGILVAARALAARLPERARTPATAGFALAALLAFQALVWPQTQLLLTQPYSRLRDVAEAVTQDPDTVRIGFGFGGRIVQVYDPEAHFANSREEIEALCHEARLAGRPVRLFHGYADRNLRRNPDFAFVYDPRFFEQVALLGAIEEPLRYRVLEPKAAACRGLEPVS